MEEIQSSGWERAELINTNCGTWEESPDNPRDNAHDFARTYIQSPTIPYRPMTNSPATGIGWDKFKALSIS